MTQLELDACDESPVGRFVVIIRRRVSGLETLYTDAGPFYTEYINFPPYCTTFVYPFTPPVEVDHAQGRHLVLVFPDVDFSSQLRFGGVGIRYRLQVSPAPFSATFTDVATNHPFFRFVEALAASGITAGCGGNAFCPDAPLTRGQMAVFLSVALGLHFPN